MDDRSPGSPERDQLERLVQAMSPPQKLRFKQAVVQQAIYFVSQHLPPEAEDEGHGDGIAAATRWLNNPTDEQAKATSIFAAAECWDGGVRYHYYPASFLEPAWTVGEMDVLRAAQRAVATAPAAQQATARQDLIAVAQAILHDKSPQ